MAMPWEKPSTETVRKPAATTSSAESTSNTRWAAASTWAKSDCSSRSSRNQPCAPGSPGPSEAVSSISKPPRTARPVHRSGSIGKWRRAARTSLEP